MAYLCSHIRQYEEKYNVEICCVDRNGLIVLEFDIERIEEEYLEDFDANRIDAGDYPGNSINELERKADEAMYQNKSEYYARTGKDCRRR